MKTRESFVPVYFQLAEDLKEKILAGELKPGDALPSETQLGEQYRISKMTVRNGLRLLAQEGLIKSFRGKGNFVAHPNLSELILKLSDPGLESSRSYDAKLLAINVISAEDGVALRLQIKPGSKLIRFRRLLLMDKEPVAVENRYLTYQRGQPLVEQEIKYADFPEAVAKHTGIITEGNQVTISAVSLNQEDSELLETSSGIPALKIEQLVYGRKNTPLGLSIMICHGEKYHLIASTRSFFS
ncbi:GntR family transcriptional regulator [Desulfitobacterium sp. PCE1]|uniref:GntR family transcriptional regulator n=1 Tax=Desulfitobacterium sp. PCE1 TaxID=146907 RepID=UPI0003639241|nr:GntR family transcriptional regulator [Desulfitobacterium sp. PCE1]